MEMKVNGRFVGISRDISTNKVRITIEVDDGEAVEPYMELKDYKLAVNVKKWRAKRSLDANAMLWACLGEMAVVLNSDKWAVYLHMLRTYGKYTYVVVKPGAVDRLLEQWREAEIVGDCMINGTKALQVLCYFGSSTYDSKEFSVLLDGVVQEMKELGLQPPPSADMRRVLEKMEQEEKAKREKESAIKGSPDNADDLPCGA